MRRRRPAAGPGLVLACAALGTGGCRPGPATPPPNVVLVSLDTLRADRVNAYGYRARALTPHLDRLAEDGILFESHVTASPWTTPAHLSLFTSLSPTAHGVTASFGHLMDSLESGGHYERLADDHETLAEALAAAGWATGAFTGGVTLDPRIGFGQGFDTYETKTAKMSEEGFSAIEAWIRAHADAPFFLFWHTFEVHAPYLHDDFLDEVVPADVARDLSAELDRIRTESEDLLPIRRERALLEEHQALRPEVCSALYDGGVRSADRWVGRLVDALRRAGLYERTLLVVTSDHGEQLGEDASATGGRGRDGRAYDAHGHTLYEEMLRVPLVVRLPGGEYAGRRVSGLTRAIDVMPTILDVVGILPRTGAFQGASLRPRWEGRAVHVPPALSEALARPKESKSVRTDRYKYIVSAGARRVLKQGRSVVLRRPGPTELYDLEADPGETHNLLLHPSPAAEAVAAELAAELARLVSERTGRPESVLLDAETLERVRALGYVE